MAQMSSTMPPGGGKIEGLNNGAVTSMIGEEKSGQRDNAGDSVLTLGLCGGRIRIGRQVIVEHTLIGIELCLRMPVLVVAKVC